MLTILHVSDLHFGPPFHPEVGESVLELAHRIQPDVIVASGDFTQRATSEQFQAARVFLDRLPPAPLVVTPGNHDVPLYRAWERLTSPYHEYRTHIASELDSVLRVPGMTIVSLNSTAPRRAITNGRIDPPQIEFARRAFAAEPPATLRIVVAHHPFAPPPDFERSDALPDARRALDAFVSMRVDMILGGHLHRAYIGNSLDVYAGADREHGIVIAQSGTTTSRRGRAREREKNSLNVIRLDRDRIRITHFLHFHDAAKFLPVSRHVFFRRARPDEAHGTLPDAAG